MKGKKPSERRTRRSGGAEAVARGLEPSSSEEEEEEDEEEASCASGTAGTAGAAGLGRSSRSGLRPCRSRWQSRQTRTRFEPGPRFSSRCRCLLQRPHMHRPTSSRSASTYARAGQEAQRAGSAYRSGGNGGGGG